MCSVCVCVFCRSETICNVFFCVWTIYLIRFGFKLQFVVATINIYVFISNTKKFANGAGLVGASGRQHVDRSSHKAMLCVCVCVFFV